MFDLSIYKCIECGLECRTGSEDIMDMVTEERCGVDYGFCKNCGAHTETWKENGEWVLRFYNPVIVKSKDANLRVEAGEVVGSVSACDERSEVTCSFCGMKGGVIRSCEDNVIECPNCHKNSLKSDFM